MEHQSPNIEELTKALIAARKDISGAKKKSKSNWGMFADLAEIIECSTEALLDNGLMLTQPVTTYREAEYVVTQITHESGQFFRSFTKIVNGKPNDPQAQGSAMSYARRYGFESMLNIPRLDADDDADRATPTQKAIENVLKNHAPQTIGTPDTGEKKVTKAQAGLIYHKLTESGLDDDEKKRWYEYHYGVDSNFRLPMRAVKEILTMIEEGSIEPVPAEAGERAEDDIPY